MNLKIISWLVPIVLELFKGNGKYDGYFKRNKTIVFLLVACLSALTLALFMFEQAVIHGTNSKLNKMAVIELTQKVTDCKTDKSKLALQCK